MKSPTPSPAAASVAPRRLASPLRSLWRARRGLSVGVAGVAIVAGWLLEPPGETVAWAVAYLAGGWQGVVAGGRALARRRLDIDVLMVLAALGALVIGAPAEGAVLLFLFSLSNALQDLALGRSRRAVAALLELRPQTARVRRGGQLATVPVDSVQVDEVYEVHPGERLPLDGSVLEGQSEVDQASLTGESAPVPKAPGDPVFGGTINGSGALGVAVTRPAHDSAIARLVRMVEQARRDKAVTERWVDRFEQPYVFGTLALTALAIAVPPLFGVPWDEAIDRAMTLMVAASPCALVLSTPAAVLSAIAVAARGGVLFKGGEHLEQAATVRSVAFDKTGTLTTGSSRLVSIECVPGSDAETARTRVCDDASILRTAAGLQARSEHHLARATLAEAKARGIDVPAPEGFLATVGSGVEASIDGVRFRLGNLRHLDDLDLSADAVHRVRSATEREQQSGRTAIVLARTHPPQALAVLAFADRIRPRAAAAVAALRAGGVEHVALISGDNRQVAETIGHEAGVDSIDADMLPADKVRRVHELFDRHGPTAFVGDGVNDAPALAAATLGVAMGGAGTDVALETADLVLMGDDLERLPWALELARRTRRTVATNLLISLSTIVVLLTALLTTGLSLPLAVVGHEGSTVLVAANGLRLLGSSRQPKRRRRIARRWIPALLLTAAFGAVAATSARAHDPATATAGKIDVELRIDDRRGLRVEVTVDEPRPSLLARFDDAQPEDGEGLEQALIRLRFAQLAEELALRLLATPSTAGEEIAARTIGSWKPSDAPRSGLSDGSVVRFVLDWVPPTDEQIPSASASLLRLVVDLESVSLGQPYLGARARARAPWRVQSTSFDALLDAPQPPKTSPPDDGAHAHGTAHTHSHDDSSLHHHAPGPPGRFGLDPRLRRLEATFTRAETAALPSSKLDRRP